MGERYLLILDLYGASLTAKISSRTSFLLVHFQPLNDQVGDAPTYVHQVAQNVKLGDPPTCFHLALSIFVLGRFSYWDFFHFYFISIGLVFK